MEMQYYLTSMISCENINYNFVPKGKDGREMEERRATKVVESFLEFKISFVDTKVEIAAVK